MYHRCDLIRWQQTGQTQKNKHHCWTIWDEGDVVPHAKGAKRIDNVVATSSEHQLNPETKRQPRFGSTDQPIEEKENDTSVRHTRGARRGGDGTDGKWATTPKCVCVDRWGREGGASDGMKEQEGFLPVHTKIRDRCYVEWHEPFYWISFVLFSHYQQDMRCSPFGCCNICCTRGR